MLPKAVDQTAGELRAALARAVITIDPAAAEKRRKQAVKDRSVTRYTDKDGMSVLRFVLSAVDTGEIYDLIDQVARRTKTSDDTRSNDAGRADAAVWLILGRDPHLGPEDDPPVPPTGAPAGCAATRRPPADRDRPARTGRRQPAPRRQPVDTGDRRRRTAPDGRPTSDDLGRDDDDLADLADEFAPDPADPDDPGPVEPTDPDMIPPDYGRGVVNQVWRDHQLGRLDTISELAALALSAMTTRRPPKLPWVTINTTTGLDGTIVQVGELQGYGPVTADYANHLLHTGAAIAPPAPSGREPTPAQTRTHDPPEWLDHEVKARDGTCRYPGCRQPAHRVDLDHTIPFPRGLTVPHEPGRAVPTPPPDQRHRLLDRAPTRHGIYTWTSTITGRSLHHLPTRHHRRMARHHHPRTPMNATGETPAELAGERTHSGDIQRRAVGDPEIDVGLGRVVPASPAAAEDDRDHARRGDDAGGDIPQPRVGEHPAIVTDRPAILVGSPGYARERA